MSTRRPAGEYGPNRDDLLDRNQASPEDRERPAASPAGGLQPRRAGGIEIAASSDLLQLLACVEADPGDEVRLFDVRDAKPDTLMEVQ
jgi:hypothetical protein